MTGAKHPVILQLHPTEEARKLQLYKFPLVLKVQRHNYAVTYTTNDWFGFLCSALTTNSDLVWRDANASIQ
jgi:hypothetical protein